MAKESFYANGTIKIKNADDVLVPFYPNTKSDCVYNYQTNQNLSTIISQMESDIAIAANSGGVKVTYDADGVETYASNQSNETMIVAIEPAVWKYTVNTSYIYQYNAERYKRVTSLPVDYDGIRQSTLTIDWGDETTSTLSGSNYTETDDTDALHQYSMDGIYQVAIKATLPHWKRLLLTSIISVYGGYLSTISSNFNSLINLRLFKTTLVSVDSPLPKVAGMYGYTKKSGNMTIKERVYNSLAGLFFECVNLTSIPEDLFVENDHITNFYGCLAGCSSLNDFTIHITSPDVTNADNFVWAKDNVERIVYVPRGSTTEATFNSVASNLGLTVIGE